MNTTREREPGDLVGVQSVKWVSTHRGWGWLGGKEVEGNTEKYPTETQSNDKDCLQSQDFRKQEIPLEDRDRGINETPYLGCKELTGE